MLRRKISEWLARRYKLGKFAPYTVDVEMELSAQTKTKPRIVMSAPVQKSKFPVKP